MSSEPITTSPPPSLFARLALAARYVITGVSPDTWFGPQQPLAPQAPPEVKGRQFDYPFGVNLSYVPRATGGISFAELRALAEPRPAELQQWLVRFLTANGLSSSKLRTNPEGSENREASRRVEFRVRTNADARIEDVLKAAER
jgi:hypothetical protein